MTANQYFDTVFVIPISYYEPSFVSLFETKLINKRARASQFILSMKIIVCIKQDPDTVANLAGKDDFKDINSNQVQFVSNPYEEFAIEEAIRIKERKEGTEITFITIGPDSAKKAIQSALAMGAHRAFHIQDDLLNNSDNYVIASILAKLIGDMEYDLILCGKHAADDDSFYVGQSLAEMLNIPHVSVITEMKFSENYQRAVVKRQVECGSEILEVPLPALFTCQKSLNVPRLPSMQGIMSVKKKEVIKLNIAGLGLKKEQVGEEGSLVKKLSASLPPSRGDGKIIEGTVDESARELVRLLRKKIGVM